MLMSMIFDCGASVKDEPGDAELLGRALRVDCQRRETVERLLR